MYSVSELLLKVSPIAICALGLLLCFKAGVWNIGAEGQYVMGAVVAGWIALAIGEFELGLAPLVVLVAGTLGGIFWASISALLKLKYNASEILTTIMLNYIAIHLLMYCVNGPLKDPEGFNFPESAIFLPSTIIPKFNDEYRLNVFILFIPILALFIWFLLAKTRFGFEVKVTGDNADAANNAGIKIKSVHFYTLIVSGALAGVAGAAEVIGPVEQLVPQIPVGYGYTAILCVFLGREHPFGVLAAAAGMGLIYTGSENLQLEYSLPGSVTFVFQGLVLFYLLLSDFLVRSKTRVSSSDD
jgi:simple sugar transport system permease protein